MHKDNINASVIVRTQIMMIYRNSTGIEIVILYLPVAYGTVMDKYVRITDENGQ